MDLDHKQHFVSWILNHLPKANSIEGEFFLQPLPGDAGFRRYYRLNTVPTLIAVDSPPSKEKNQEFIAVSLAFQAKNIKSPKIYAVDFQNGFMLLEDFGEQLLLPLLTSDSVAKQYQQAESILLTIHQVPFDARVFPKYDRSDFAFELSLCRDWFFDRLLGLTMENSSQDILDATYQALIDNALRQPQNIVHRDFHSRNIMLLQTGDMGIIDYQDAVLGPITYDLVSLLKDCYVGWPRDMVVKRALNFKDQLLANKIIEDVDNQTFLKWFDLMGLQRHIKVLGIFSRLALRDGKVSYLQDLPLVINYVLDASQRYSETQAFASWFELTIMPVLSLQKWYKGKAVF